MLQEIIYLRYIDNKQAISITLADGSATTSPKLVNDVTFQVDE